MSHILDLTSQEHKKRLIFMLLLVILSLLVTSLYWFINEGNSTTLAVVLVFITIYLVPLYLTVTSRRYALASNLFLVITTALLLVLMWQNEGIRDESVMVFPGLLIFSILFGSKRAFSFIFAVVMINILVLGYLNEVGFMHNQVSKGGVASAFVTCIIFTVIAVAAKMISGELTQTVNELEQYKTQLEEKVARRTDELIESQNKLNQSEKMAALGRLVAGLAHEINTPVGVAMTASSHINEQNKRLKVDIDAGTLTKTKLQKYLSQLDESASLVNANLFRAAELIADFKNVSVLTSNERKVEFNVAQVINKTVETLQPVLIENQIKMTLSLASDVRIFRDPANLTQSITNLILNSIHHAFDLSQTNNEISIRACILGGDVNILYQDNGVGIDSEVQQHIFEPFFTTKRSEGGTGLGMHIVYNMITQGLGGKISVLESGSGAKFTVRIPIGEGQ